MIQSILVVAPSPDYTHHQALFDTALAFSNSLKDLGFPCEVTVDPSSAHGKTLVFGAHLIPKFGGTIEGGDYVIFNLEQHDSPWMTAEYTEILKRHEVWDYSRNNIDALKRHGVEAKLCDIGYHPCMSNIRLGKSATVTGGVSSPAKVEYVSAGVGAPVGVFDVLFYGSVNERRQKIIDGFRDAGKNVAVVVGYGAYRDKYIARAKVVLNLHYYDSALFEVVRVSHLLANEKCVVSEFGKEDELEKPYRDGVAFAPYEDIVPAVLALLENEEKRTATAKAGFEAIKKRPQKDIIKQLLGDEK